MRAGYGGVIRFLSRFSLEWALGLLVLGSRLWAFAYAGSPLPFYDQWLAEFNNTFLQFVGGAGVWSVLLTPHNEHVLFTAKIATLAGFQLNGYWDVEFLVVLAALVRAAVAVGMFRLLTQEAGAGVRKVMLVACAVVFAAPLSGYNLLCGLQISFYFSELALLWSMRCVMAWSTGWRSGSALVLGSVGGLLSMGSALAIPAATLAVHLAASRKRPGFWIAWAISVACTLVYAGVLLALQPPKAMPGSIWGRAMAFAELYSWPLLHWACGLGLLGLTMVAIVRLTGEGGLKAKAVASALGVGAFGGVNTLLIALNRPAGEFHLRHWETVSLVPLALIGLALAALGRAEGNGGWRRLTLPLLGAVYLAAAGVAFWKKSWPYLESARTHRAAALAHYRALLVSDRIAEERTRMNALLAAKDYSFFDDPIGRFSLHPVAVRNFQLAPLPAMALLAPEILPLRPPSGFSRTIRAVKGGGAWIAIAGLGLFVLGLARRSDPAAAANIPARRTCFRERGS